MKRLDMTSPGARLDDALCRLEHTWLETRQQWNDPVAERVEEEFISTIRARVRTLLDAIAKSQTLLRKAEYECQHPRERTQQL
ncbi:MAG: hypothetical protein ACK5TG_21975 [Planctomyces sp.]|jgi:hypothetical protein|nr:hypothetical protein [Planctomyces sp.]GDX92597.1 hypothetical protein LBMAG46_26050 [Planctomycetia bacterium]